MCKALFTIGHGNRAAEELSDLLLAAGVVSLVDIRAHPGSRRHPQFSQTELAKQLPLKGIAYRWEGEALGGRRRAHAQSRNVGWRNASFRAYADHMESAEFRAAAASLMERAAESCTAIMCAERLPWQCHRYLVSDYVVAHGMAVVHLIAPGSKREHALNPMARVVGGVLVYDRATQKDLDLGE